MKSSADRVPVRRTLRDRFRGADRDLLPAMALFWAISAVRVVGALLRHEVFGTEATLALMALVAIPCAALLRRRSKPA